MAVFRDTPYGNARFSVEFDGMDPVKGIMEVILPEMILEIEPIRTGDAPENAPLNSVRHPRFSNLVIRRYLSGSTDLYAWWKEVAQGSRDKAKRVTIHLWSEDGAAIVLSWRVDLATPVRYSFSPLNGNDGSAVIETLEMGCHNVEIE